MTDSRHKARDALAPFAAVADGFDEDGRILSDHTGIYANTAGDFRRAREALQALEREIEGEAEPDGTLTWDGIGKIFDPRCPCKKCVIGRAEQRERNRLAGESK